jgi:hypothetical protein
VKAFECPLLKIYSTTVQRSSFLFQHSGLTFIILNLNQTRMKKIVIALTLLIGCVSSRAQSPVDFGIKAGVNIASFNGEGTNNSDVTSRTSMNAGAFMRYFISSGLVLRPELFYGGHGAKEGDNTYRFSSIFLPVLISYYLSTFYLMAGPQLSYLITAQSKFPGGTSNVREFYNALNFSAVMCTGLMFGKRFGLDARYNLGIGDIYKNSTASIHNTIFMIDLIMLFNK